MSFGLPDSVISRIQGVMASHPSVTRCIVYGSRAKGTYHDGSDIDLTLKGEIAEYERDAIEASLEDLELPWTIDLSVYAQLDNAALVEHIDRVGVVLWSRSGS